MSFQFWLSVEVTVDVVVEVTVGVTVRMTVKVMVVFKRQGPVGRLSAPEDSGPGSPKNETGGQLPHRTTDQDDACQDNARESDDFPALSAILGGFLLTGGNISRHSGDFRNVPFTWRDIIGARKRTGAHHRE